MFFKKTRHFYPLNLFSVLAIVLNYFFLLADMTYPTVGRIGFSVWIIYGGSGGQNPPTPLLVVTKRIFIHIQNDGSFQIYRVAGLWVDLPNLADFTPPIIPYTKQVQNI